MTEASVFYEAASPHLGREFLDDVQRGIALLCTHPRIGQSIGGGLRRVLLHRFPFSLIYAVEADTILIIAVAPTPTARLLARQNLKLIDLYSS